MLKPLPAPGKCLELWTISFQRLSLKAQLAKLKEVYQLEYKGTSAIMSLLHYILTTLESYSSFWRRYALLYLFLPYYLKGGDMVVLSAVNMSDLVLQP